jgi:hypothetical protein
MAALVYKDGGAQDIGGEDGDFQLDGYGLQAFISMAQDPTFQGR